MQTSTSAYGASMTLIAFLARQLQSRSLSNGSSDLFWIHISYNPHSMLWMNEFFYALRNSSKWLLLSTLRVTNNRESAQLLRSWSVASRSSQVDQGYQTVRLLTSKVTGIQLARRFWSSLIPACRLSYEKICQPNPELYRSITSVWITTRTECLSANSS